MSNTIKVGATINWNQSPFAGSGTPADGECIVVNIIDDMEFGFKLKHLGNISPVFAGINGWVESFENPTT